MFGAVLRRKLCREGWFLRERLTSGCQANSLSTVNPEHSVLLAWEVRTAPEHPSNFEKRLEWSGANREIAAWSVEPPANLVPQNPPWLPLLEEIAHSCCIAAPVRKLGSNGHIENETQLPFEDLWHAVVRFASRRLRDVVSPIELQGVGPNAVTALENSLLSRICAVTEQPLWEQFSRSRKLGQRLLIHINVDAPGSSQGNAGTCNTAYLAFINSQLESGLARLLCDYPVLGRLISTLVSLWIETSTELLKRIYHDRSAIETTFDVEPGASLKGIRLDLSDRHRGGRSVALLTFTGNVKVVYKPKDLRLDAAYQVFLTSCNELAGECHFRVLTVLPRDGYGYVEWVDHRLCTSVAELKRFYWNAGRLLTVLHILGCTDCHYENLIASGEQLVLIDSETLFTGDVLDPVHSRAKGSLQDLSLTGRSVLQIGLLPHWVYSGTGSRVPVDISALGVSPPQERESKQRVWLSINSDSMRPCVRKRPLKLPTSSPVDFGSENCLQQYLHPLLDGFVDQYERFLENRQVFLAEGSGLNAFRGLRCRFVFRETRTYFRLLQQALEPEALRSGTGFSIKLDQLCRCYVIEPGRPGNWRMFEAELRDMEQLDVPFFEQCTDGTALILGHDLRPIEMFLEVSGLESSRRRMRSLSNNDREFQRKLISGSIQASQLRQVRSCSDVDQHPSGETTKLEGSVLLDEALAIGRELRERAIRDEQGRPEWLGSDLGKDLDKFQFGLIGTSLHGGQCGIALFFASLVQNATDPVVAREFRTEVNCILEPLLTVIKESEDREIFRWLRDEPLGLIGTGGLLLTLLELHHQDFQFRDNNLLEAASRVVAVLDSKRISRDKSYDVMAGGAGLIGPLLRLQRATGKDSPLELATVIGDHLISHQHSTGGWRDPTMGSKPLTGFSHGAAGIAAALGRLHSIRRDNRYRTAAGRALAYERNCFVPERKNWPDFRKSEEPNDFMMSWCHGAPGIALGRLCLKDTALWDETCQEEVHVGLESTASTVFGGPDHVCCGNFGKIAVLQQAGQILGEARWEEKSLELASKAIHRRHANGCYQLYTTPAADFWLPGFFTGTAGIGFQLLASNNPQFSNPMLSAALLNLGR